MNDTAPNTMFRWLPWLTVLFGCAMLMVSNGLTITGLSVHDESLLGAFEWTRSQIKFRDMVTLTLTGLLAPLGGILIDRYGVRRCMIIGWSTLMVGYFMYSRIESLWELYAIHALFSVTLIFCGLNAAVILVSHWFVKNRGMAIGFVLVGTSLGGVVFPQYGVYASEAIGWRNTFLAGMAFPLVMLLVSLVAVRDRPGAIATETPENGASSASDKLPGMEFIDAIKSRTFWAITLIAMFTFYTVLGTQAHLFLYMRDLGFDAHQGANAISTFFFCALVGKFTFGVVADYFNHRKVFLCNLLVMFAGTVMLALMQPTMILPAVIAYGLGWGGAYTVLQLIVINSFGLRSAGKILGSITVLDAIGGGLGIWMTGLLYDEFGNYQLAFTVFSVMVGVALCGVGLIKPNYSSGADARQENA